MLNYNSQKTKHVDLRVVSHVAALKKHESEQFLILRIFQKLQNRKPNSELRAVQLVIVARDCARICMITLLWQANY